jgi:hypothetical protein
VLRRARRRMGSTASPELPRPRRLGRGSEWPRWAGSEGRGCGGGDGGRRPPWCAAEARPPQGWRQGATGQNPRQNKKVAVDSAARGLLLLEGTGQPRSHRHTNAAGWAPVVTAYRITGGVGAHRTHWVRMGVGWQGVGRIFLYFFYHGFAKIYDPSEILQKYTSTVVTHGVRDITPRHMAIGADSSGLVVWEDISS